MTRSVGVGFVGTGFAKSVQMPAFMACDGAHLVSVASGSPGKAETVAKEFGIQHFTDDWRETVAHPDVDLVCITTPPNLHREMGLFAIENGKHILAEKPMAMNLAEAEEMLAASAGSGRLSLIDHELRFQPGRLQAWNMLREGAIGKVRHAKYNFRAPHRGDPSVAWNWWSDISAGGGALGAINSHVIDSFNWFLGAEIDSVYCQLQTHVKERPYGDGEMRAVTTDDEANMLLRFADGDLTEDATGLVSVSMVEQPEYVNRLEFFGTDGAIRVDGRGDIFVAKNSGTWNAVDTEFGQPIDGVPDTGFSRGFMEFAPRIVEAISGGRSEIEHAATFSDGVKVQRVLDAARESNSGKIAVNIARNN